LQHSVDPAGPPGYAGRQLVKHFMIISDSPNAFPMTGSAWKRRQRHFSPTWLALLSAWGWWPPADTLRCSMPQWITY